MIKMSKTGKKGRNGEGKGNTGEEWGGEGEYRGGRDGGIQGRK